MNIAPFTEAEFTRQVLQLARIYHWRSAHFRPARTAKGWHTAVQGDGAGFPDLVLIRGNKVLWVELKVGAKLSQHQMEWIAALKLAGQDARVWRPADWPEIEASLRNIQ